MTETETIAANPSQAAEIKQADALVGLTSPPGEDSLRQLTRHLTELVQELSPSSQIALALPAMGMVASEDTGAELRLLSYTPASYQPGSVPWTIQAEAQHSLFELAERLQVKACTVLGANPSSISKESLRLLLEPCLANGCDLVMPLYPSRPLESLVNSAVLYPLTRALYGKRIRFPLASEMQLSTLLLSKLRAAGISRARPASTNLFAVSTEASMQGLRLCQARLDFAPDHLTGNIDLSAILAEVLGPLFTEVEAKATYWQRVRGSQDVPVIGPATAVPQPTEPIDTRRMIDAFQLGSRNLQEIWAIILPPVSLLGLKRLAQSSPESFRMPDELWVRIVYDFALAHRTRSINRAHLFGAFTSLYLGWVASYAMELAPRYDSEQADRKIEDLARAFESDKPYFLSRWRWPDRFNP